MYQSQLSRLESIIKHQSTSKLSESVDSPRVQQSGRKTQLDVPKGKLNSDKNVLQPIRASTLDNRVANYSIISKNNLVEFDKVKQRDFNYQSIYTCNDNRFENINKFPSSYSKNKIYGSPNIKRFSNRRPFVQIKALSKDRGVNGTQNAFYPGNPQYDPPYDKYKANLKLSILNFKKGLDREENNNLKGFRVPNQYDQEKIIKGQMAQSTFKKVLKPLEFNKQLPRDNKLYKISEVSNLDPKEDPFLKKFFMIEEVARNRRMANALSLLNQSLKLKGGDTFDQEESDTDEEMSQLALQRRMSLEDKILSGYYKT